MRRAHFYMNKVCINGRLIREPDYKELENNNSVCTIFIANDVFFGQNKKTGFFKVVAWGKMGKIIADNCATGTELYITGRLEQSQYQDEHDKTIYDVYIVLEQFDFGVINGMEK